MTVFKKSLLTLGVAIFIFSAALIIFSIVFMNNLYYEINTIALKNTARTLFNTIGKDNIINILSEHEDADVLAKDIDIPLNNSGDYRLTIIATTGYVIWDSHVQDRLVNHLDREEVTGALDGYETSTTRNSISTGEKLIYFALPVFERSSSTEEKPVGVFRVSVTVPGFIARLSSVIVPFLVISCFLMIIAFWAIYAYSFSLADSVGRLVSIAQSSAPFLSGPEAEEQVAPEFRSLEKALRAMTQELNRRFEQAKAESARLEAILNGMSEALFAMDCELKLLLVNPRARELFNIADCDTVEMSLLEATHSAELEEIAKKALVADNAIETDLTLRAQTEQYFQVFATRLAESGHVILVLQDVTRLVKLERVRKDFVANVSHELRTPIQLIKGFSETLLDTINDNDIKKIIHFIEIIQKNAGTMENLTNDLLVLADLENNTNNGRDMEEAEVEALIKEAVFSVETQAKRKNIEVIVNCPGKLKAKLYPAFIIQALINLIDNAIKYSPDKSKVWVSAELSENESELAFVVRDKGIGIPAEYQEKIFERFYRVDKARAHTSSKEAGGTGLGLSIVRHIALLHKGKAEVNSPAQTGGSPGNGSIFKITIPYSK